MHSSIAAIPLYVFSGSRVDELLGVPPGHNDWAQRKHCQECLNPRRELCPEHEDDDAAPKKRAELEEHFDERKVELGNCDRTYGSPCQHEHACVRCPTLQVAPAMLTRLAEIEKDLMLPRNRGEEEQWLGETEGTDLTLTSVRTKQPTQLVSRAEPPSASASQHSRPRTDDGHARTPPTTPPTNRNHLVSE